MKKTTKKFLKGLQKQNAAATAGTRYTLHADTAGAGMITKDEPRGKGKKKDAKQEPETKKD